MFKNRVIGVVAIVGAIVLLSGCGEYEKLLKRRIMGLVRAVVALPIV